MPADAHLKNRIAAVRRFNRFYTRQIGLLRKSYLDSPFSLGEMRVLYEIAHAESPNASDIARKLGLDAGYLSRMLRAFEKRGLVARVRSKDDARQSEMALDPVRTAHFRVRTSVALAAPSRQDAGKDVRGRPVASGRRHAGHRRRCLASNPGSRRRCLWPARCTAGRLRLDRGSPRRALRQEYQWTEPFEGLCAQIVADFVNKHDPRRERCWIADRDGENVGSIMLVKECRGRCPHPAAAGRAQGARARHWASRLVDECLRFAREAGYRRVTLWTHSVLTAARNIYQRAGFKLVANPGA